MLQAYFDESGIHKDAAVTMIAGYVATVEVWTAVEARWASELGKLSRYGVSWFHMVDCLHGKKPFRLIDEKRRRELIDALSGILEQAEVHAVWAGVNTAQWDLITTEEFRERYPKPYDLCFDEIVVRAAQQQREPCAGRLCDSERIRGTCQSGL